MTAAMEMIYVADPMCSWCYGFAPVIDALAEGCSTLFFTLASERIVLGGGVINQRHWLVEEIAFQTARKLGGYLPYIGDRAPIVAARLGADAGQRGALLLAEKALQSQA